MHCLVTLAKLFNASKLQVSHLKQDNSDNDSGDDDDTYLLG